VSFSERLKIESMPRKDSVDKLNDYIHALDEVERDAILELLNNYPTRIGFDALKDEGYRINRESVGKWKQRYGV